MGIREERHKVDVYLFPDEFEVLKNLCEKDNMSYSEYLRTSFLVDAVTRGNPTAIKIMARRGVELIKKKWVQYGLVREEKPKPKVGVW